MRGYLWEDLADEVAAEFAELCHLDFSWVVSPYASALQLHEDGDDRRERLRVKEFLEPIRNARHGNWWARLVKANRVAAQTRTGNCRTPRREQKRKTTRIREKRAMRERERLPELRKGITKKFTIFTREAEEVEGYITTGCYEDGRLGEVFVTVGKMGDWSRWVDSWAIAVSKLLQYGASVDEVFKKHVGEQFDPAGATNCKEVPRCTSVVDLVSRWVLAKYGSLA